MQISFLRHGRSSTAGTYTGKTDVSLSPDGVEEITAISPLIKNQCFDICYCSPLKRCRETHLLLEVPVRCEIVEDFSEINFGSWEGLTFTQISQKDPENLKKWMQLKDHFTFPGGENIQVFNNRVRTQLDAIKKGSSKKVLVISHGGVIKTALNYLLGINRNDCFAIAEGSLSTLILEDERAYLQQLNCRGI